MDEKCSDCGTPVQHKHSLCISCEIDAFSDYDEEASGCANCGGEGFTYGCGWDWQCDTWDGDSCLCTQRCEWCTEPSPAEKAGREKMRVIMAEAFAMPVTRATALSDLIAGDADLIVPDTLADSDGDDGS